MITINKFILTFALTASLILNTGFTYNPKIEPTINLKSPEAGIDITTTKIARIFGTINEKSFDTFKNDMESTASISGDRLILIKSHGGLVHIGEAMLAMIRKEQKENVKIICFAIRNSDSMAFNILSNCDVRLMAPGTTSLVHKIARVYLDDVRLTAKNLKKIAEELETGDEPYRQTNAKAMHLTVEEYDKYADKETYWTATTLLKMRYLHGLAFVIK